jgi:hypothetical protein
VVVLKRTAGVVNASASDKNLLLHAIRHENADLKMPKETDKHSDALIADLTRWSG